MGLIKYKISTTGFICSGEELTKIGMYFLVFILFGVVLLNGLDLRLDKVLLDTRKWFLLFVGFQ